jgi:hypothetical protein
MTQSARRALPANGEPIVAVTRAVSRSPSSCSPTTPP